MERLETPLLRGSKVRGYREASKFSQSRRDRSQSRLGLEGVRRARNALPGVRAHDIERILEQCAAICFVGDAVGLDENPRFARAKSVALHFREHDGLLALGQSAESVSQRRPDGPSRHPFLDCGAQAIGNREPNTHPGRLPTQDVSDGTLAELLSNESAHNAGLVECRDRPRRRVECENETKSLLLARWGFDENGDELSLVLSPTRESLEPVEDLVSALAYRHDAQGKLCGETRSRRARAKHRVARPQTLDGDELNGPHDVARHGTRHTIPRRLASKHEFPPQAPKAQ